MADTTSDSCCNYPSIDDDTKCHRGFIFDKNTIKKEPGLIIEEVCENKDGIKDFLEQNNSDTNVILYDCVICDERFPTTKMLLVHLKEHARKNKENPSKIGQLKCTLKELFRDYVKIKVDLYGNPTYMCKLCPSKTFDKKMSITEHMRTHEHPTYKDLNCVFCGEVFPTLDGFLVHITTHKEDELFRCERSLLIAHRKTVEANMKIKIYKCSYCEKIFSSKSAVKYHLQVHEKKYLYSCKTCNNGFKYKSSYTRHLHNHTLEELLSNKCGICSFKAKSSSNLEKHMRTHTVQQYDCSLCGKTYLHKTSLKYHLQTHSGEKPYKCTECNKSFTTKSILTRHSIIHTEIRPYYECSDCGKQYAQKWRLKIHQNSHSMQHHIPEPDNIAIKCSPCLAV